ncbi:MAG TPA: hypothetical protein VJX67_09795, partial [Blastocatellia bacterium]|nr:hypothetical protein [Blastocatellia bacterium]
LQDEMYRGGSKSKPDHRESIVQPLTPADPVTRTEELLAGDMDDGFGLQERVHQPAQPTQVRDYGAMPLEAPPPHSLVMPNQAAGENDPALTPQEQRVLRVIKRGLEDLLTLLNSEC